MDNKNKRLTRAFFRRETTLVARELLGKILVRVFDDNAERRYMITETEAYCGENDLACHASKGKTRRTAVMYDDGGLVYVYLIYGMYQLLNVVAESKGSASAVLIRSIDKVSGPGRVGRELQLDASFYGEDLTTSTRMWIEDANHRPTFRACPRIGIMYAGEPWTSMDWRYVADI